MMKWMSSSTSSPLRESRARRWRQSAAWRAAVLLVVIFVAAWPSACAEAATLEGILYLSTTGDASGEVFWGAREEVRLLKPEFTREWDELRRRTLPWIHDLDRSADAALTELLRSANEERRTREKEYRGAEDRRRKARQQYEAAVDALIAKYTVETGTADAQGRFRFKKVSPGTYLLSARMAMPEMGLFYHWLIIVEVGEEGPVTVELTTKNAASLYY